MYRTDAAASELAGGTYRAPDPARPDPAPLDASRQGWLHWLGLAISGAVLAAILVQLRDIRPAELVALLPASAVFWLTFTAYYFVQVVSEWAIYRRLWKISASGLVALTRKYIGNEILFGYIGEVYFYTWARKRSRMTGAPFGAIKDVTILSAVVGNVATLVLMAIAFPLLGELQFGLGGRAFYLSTFVLVATSLAALLFRRRLFSLPAADLRFVIGAHAARIVVKTALAALMWHLVLPQVPIGWWLILAALRLLLSRLPFLPNKDLAFVALAVVAIGHDSQIAALLGMIAALLLATHVILGALLTGSELAGLKERS
ncbi:hypothetical protein RCO27_14110 [Sphingosinicella sp. LHD-64]|uniref:hypothetical protein n=1 Tax=Sphingosinicella sp. LHD-64 TaxID=3072139 RepID=UPI00280F0EAB|nr:hypothetical protein [Sphingosinicella sp. LHD-64]MDQ8757360.1 hypothetical protein [Sphingosinicella sp. LHD-64]